MIGSEPERGERDNALLAVEDAQDDVLAVNGRLHGDTEIDLPAAHVERGMAVLRRARLGDVERRQHLDANRHRRPVRLVQRTDLPEHAVDPVADAQETGFGFEVDVGGVAPDRVGEDRINQADDRLTVFARGDLEAGEVDFARLDLAQDAVDRQLVAVMLVDGAGDFGLAGEARLDVDVVAELRAHLVECDDVVHVGQREHETTRRRVPGDRQQPVAHRQRPRDQRQRKRVDDRLRQIDAALS